MVLLTIPCISYFQSGNEELVCLQLHKTIVTCAEVVKGAVCVCVCVARRRGVCVASALCSVSAPVCVVCVGNLVPQHTSLAIRQCVSGMSYCKQEGS